MAGHDINKEIRAYWLVFGALLVFTGLTVGVSYIPFVISMSLIVGLAVALCKGTMVALIFMHLKAEKRLIYWSLFFTVIFFFACILLPILTEMDQLDESPNGGFYHGTALPDPEDRPSFTHYTENRGGDH